MESSQSRLSMAGSAAKPPASGSASKTKRSRRQPRRALVDLTNSDSPITGLSLCEISSPGTPGTPGNGEDLLRSQVRLLLRQVQGDAPAPRGPLFGFHRPGSSACFPSCGCLSWSSPGIVVGPTPANTPLPVADPNESVVNELSKITIGETVCERHLSLDDRLTSRSLDFDSLLDDSLPADSVVAEK